MIDPSYISSLLCFDIKTTGRDNIFVEEMLTSTYKGFFKTEQNYPNHYFLMLNVSNFAFL